MLKAQTTIDIFIRNLFERTADVGFLATDDDLVAFMANDHSCSTDEAFIDQRIKESKNMLQNIPSMMIFYWSNLMEKLKLS